MFGPYSNLEGKMKWKVQLTRDITESVGVTVEAATKEEANEKALVLAGRYGLDIEGWATDDQISGDVYLPDPDSTAEAQ